MLKEASHFDLKVWTELIDLTGGQLVLLAELLDSYIASAPARFARLESAIAAHDHKKIEFEAHSLKSTAAAIGIFKLNEICFKIEAAGRESRLVDEDLKEALKLEFKESFAEIVEGRASIQAASSPT